MKRGRFYPLAEALFDGGGTPRYREGIVAEIERALESTHTDGKAEGRLPPKKRRGAPRTVPPGMDERFMVRCTAEDLERYRAEAARRGLARGRDTGVGALARIGLDTICSTTCGKENDGTLCSRTAGHDGMCEE